MGGSDHIYTLLKVWVLDLYLFSWINAFLCKYYKDYRRSGIALSGLIYFGGLSALLGSLWSTGDMHDSHC